MKANIYLMALLIGISACSPEKQNIKIENVGKENYNNRFQITTSPAMVIDTATGQVWKAVGDQEHGYSFAQICYKSQDGKNLMPTPYEDTIVSDLSAYQKTCRQN